LGRPKVRLNMEEIVIGQWGMGWGCEGGQGKMEVGFEGKR